MQRCGHIDSETVQHDHTFIVEGDVKTGDHIVYRCAFGYVHFASLERVTRLFTGGGPLWRAIALQLARLAVLAALMVALALLGVGALLAGMFGVIAAREIVLRRVRKEAAWTAR